jgi:hypothetical protein
MDSEDAVIFCSYIRDTNNSPFFAIKRATGPEMSFTEVDKTSIQVHQVSCHTPHKPWHLAMITPSSYYNIRREITSRHPKY